jgi:hypothetical protein
MEKSVTDAKVRGDKADYERNDRQYRESDRKRQKEI